MEYVNISDELMVACIRTGNQYSYSFIDNDDKFSKIHKKSPIEHSKNSEIGKIIFSMISSVPIQAISESERKQTYLRMFNTVLQDLQDNISREDNKV